MSKESQRDKTGFAPGDSCRSDHTNLRTVRALFEVYSVEQLQTLSMQYKTLYRYYKFPEALLSVSGSA